DVIPVLVGENPDEDAGVEPARVSQNHLLPSHCFSMSNSETDKAHRGAAEVLFLKKSFLRALCASAVRFCFFTPVPFRRVAESDSRGGASGRPARGLRRWCHRRRAYQGTPTFERCRWPARRPMPCRAECGGRRATRFQRATESSRP